jgi:hypothetical protein
MKSQNAKNITLGVFRRRPSAAGWHLWCPRTESMGKR